MNTIPKAFDSSRYAKPKRARRIISGALVFTSEQKTELNPLLSCVTYQLCVRAAAQILRWLYLPTER